MQFKATSDFRNTHKFKIKGRKSDEVHIGKGDTFDADLDDPKMAEVIAILGHSGRIIDVENQPKNGDKIDAEVKAAADKAAAEEAKSGKK